jgi:hypothetical protein
MSNDAPKLLSKPLDIYGQQVQVAFDVDPETFPNGVEFLLMVPGSLEPLGKLEVARGAMLLAMPAEMAVHFRAQIKKVIVDAQKKAAAQGVQ